MLVGNVGQPPEIKDLGDSKKVANLNLATTESYKNKEGTMPMC
jgi:single-stranded DNA-binding protein